MIDRSPTPEEEANMWEQLEKDPEYEANLRALSRVDRERLLNGNWNIKLKMGFFLLLKYIN